MIVIIFWQTVLRHLLYDHNEGLDEVLEITGSLSNLIKIVIKRCSHDRGVSIAKCAFHMLIKVCNWLVLVEIDQNHDRLFPNHFLLVLHQSKHYILNCGDNTCMRQF